MDSPFNAIPVIRPHRYHRRLVRIAHYGCDFGTLGATATPITTVDNTSEWMRSALSPHSFGNKSIENSGFLHT
jgi:hypothetical protein